MDVTGLKIRPRFVWGRGPRLNGGCRRPRGFMGRYKYPPAVGCGASYPAPLPKPPLPTFLLEDFPLVLMALPAPTGIPQLDAEVGRLMFLYANIARIRSLLLARAQVLTSSPVFRSTTKRIWGEHDTLLRVVEGIRSKMMSEYGFTAPAVPHNFYNRF